jgi:hypothetical protein
MLTRQLKGVKNSFLTFSDFQIFLFATNVNHTDGALNLGISPRILEKN